jgi:tRNA-binding protein
MSIKDRLSTIRLEIIFDAMELASFEDFQQVDIRVGTIIHAEPFTDAKKAAYKLTIDFGSLGKKTSSAQITALYSLEDLKGRQVMAVVNFPVKRIAGFKSEVLVLGIVNEEKEVVLLKPASEVPNGSVVR